MLWQRLVPIMQCGKRLCISSAKQYKLGLVPRSGAVAIQEAWHNTFNHKQTSHLCVRLGIGSARHLRHHPIGHCIGEYVCPCIDNLKACLEAEALLIESVLLTLVWSHGDDVYPRRICSFLTVADLQGQCTATVVPTPESVLRRPQRSSVGFAGTVDHHTIVWVIIVCE